MTEEDEMIYLVSPTGGIMSISSPVGEEMKQTMIGFGWTEVDYEAYQNARVKIENEKIELPQQST